MSEPIPIEHRKMQLESLIESLDDLITVLELDPTCQWAKHFRRMRSEGELLMNTVSQDAINSFSASVTSVYGGMGSFNDYCPCPQHLRIKAASRLHSMENLGTFSSAVYDRALDLRVVGRR